MGMGSSSNAMPQGLGPSALANFNIGSSQVKAAMPDIQRYGMEMSGLATGGLLNKGLTQIQQGLSAPSIGSGIQTRTLQRYGATMPPAAQAELNSQNAVRTAASRVGISNNARDNLWEQQLGLEFGG
jgi:hypothetical protein